MTSVEEKCDEQIAALDHDWLPLGRSIDLDLEDESELDIKKLAVLLEKTHGTVLAKLGSLESSLGISNRRLATLEAGFFALTAGRRDEHGVVVPQ